MKAISYKGQDFILENIASCLFEVDRPAQLSMNSFSMPPPAKQAYLIIRRTDGFERTIIGPDAVELKQIFEKAGVHIEQPILARR